MAHRLSRCGRRPPPGASVTSGVTLARSAGLRLEADFDSDSVRPQGRAVSETESELLARAAKIHATCRPLDAHADVPMIFGIAGLNLRERGQPPSILHQIDFPRWREGAAAGVCFAIWTAQGPRTTEGHVYAAALAERLFARTLAFLETNADLAGLARTADDFARLHATGRAAVFLGVENGWPLGRDLSLVERFRKLGACYLGLCHVENNEVCDSSTADQGPEHGGLSAFGREVVAECNRVGLIVDVSHASDDATRQAAELSRAPIIASHSNARAVCAHPRNLPDDLIRLIASRGGVIHVTFYHSYVRPTPRGCDFLRANAAYLARPQDPLPDDDQLIADWFDWESVYRLTPPPFASLSQAIDHLDHIVKLVGVDHVGIGTDFDGGGLVQGCEDIAKFPAITLELVRRGYSAEDIRKIWSENTLRVMRAACP